MVPAQQVLNPGLGRPVKQPVPFHSPPSSVAASCVQMLSNQTRGRKRQPGCCVCRKPPGEEEAELGAGWPVLYPKAAVTPLLDIKRDRDTAHPSHCLWHLPNKAPRVLLALGTPPSVSRERAHRPKERPPSSVLHAELSTCTRDLRATGPDLYYLTLYKSLPACPLHPSHHRCSRLH